MSPALVSDLRDRHAPDRVAVHGWTNPAGGRIPGAALAEPASIKPILVDLDFPAEPPRVASARGPPLDDLDQAPTFDLTDLAPPTLRGHSPDGVDNTTEQVGFARSSERTTADRIGFRMARASFNLLKRR